MFVISSNVLPRHMLGYMYFPSQKKFINADSSSTFQISPLRDTERILPGLSINYSLAGIKLSCSYYKESKTNLLMTWLVIN